MEESIMEPQISDPSAQLTLFMDPPTNLSAQIEAIVFASPDPMKLAEITSLLGGEIDGAVVESALDSLVSFYRERSGGFRLEYVDGMGYQFRTDPAMAPLMEKQFAQRPKPLSRAALETLSIIAYKQPVTRADVEYVRGVDAGSIFKALMDRNLIACVGRREEIGRPMLFGTTDEFLKVFQIGSLKDLPALQSFQPSQEVLEQSSALTSDIAPVDIDGFIRGDERENPEEAQQIG